MIPVEEIERVIDDLRTRIEKLETVNDMPLVDVAIRVYNQVIDELQKVAEDRGKSKS